MVSIIKEKNLIFDRLYQFIGLRYFFLLTTIDLIDVFCRQSIIGIDPIDVFLTIGAQLWCPLPTAHHPAETCEPAVPCNARAAGPCSVKSVFGVLCCKRDFKGTLMKTASANCVSLRY
jgi:hypothetical protein